MNKGFKERIDPAEQTILLLLSKQNKSKPQKNDIKGASRRKT